MQVMKDEKKKNILKTLCDLYSVFFKIGAFTFGGGIAMLPILQRELVDKRKWMEDGELVDYFAIGQSTPGIIAVNVATFCGHKLAGTIGGVVATIGIISPSIIIISLFAYFIDSINQIPWIKKAMRGINAAVAANMTYAVINLGKKNIKTAIGAFLFIASFVCVFFFKINAVFLIFASALTGVLIYLCSAKKSGGENE